jgi:dinuclear metal center YbgI/SA1388 family protein
MSTVLMADVMMAMESFAPLSLAEPWDNVGLLIGDRQQPLTGPVVLTIDLTPAVMDECEQIKASAVIAYHPIIFEPIKRLTTDDARQKTALRAIRSNIAIYSPHTALDSAAGCMSDWLTDMVFPAGKPRAGDRRALVPKPLPAADEECKIVTFVPAAEVDRLRSALASAGAGQIGGYSVCSFAAPGEGSFFAAEDTRPAVGKKGQLEKVAEVRLEMVLSRRAVPLALQTLQAFHPYEQPAIDVYDLRPKALRNVGAGRRVVLDEAVTIQHLAERIRTNLGLTHVQIAPAPGREHDTFDRVGICPGAGASLAEAARRESCPIFVTGEMKHHEVLEANAQGQGVILAGHSNTERGYLPRLAEKLRHLVPGVLFDVSKADRTLMRMVDGVR